jgi:AcrR family transcriptional regulator
MSRNSPPARAKPNRASTSANSLGQPAEIKAIHSPPAKKGGVVATAETTKNLVVSKKESARKMDPRVRGTRDALGDALVALMQERPFETITVQHVLDRAEVSRSTFYSHYSDKNDLFLSDVEDFFEMMSTALIRHGDTSTRVAPVQEFFAHVAEMRQFISSLAASEKVRDVFELGQGHFARAIEQRLATLPSTRNLSATRRSALAHASAGSLFSLLNWWLDHGGSATPAQMDALFHQTMWSGINPPAKATAPTPNRLATRKPL